MSPDQSCSLFFVGTATTVLRFGPFTLMTDPNFLHQGQYAYLGKGLVSRRRTQPAVGVSELPPLDAILLSHMHGDHWDRVAKRELDHGLQVITTPKAAKALVRQGFGASRGLATWESTTLEKQGARLRITAMPGRHAPGIAQRFLPPVMGSMLEYEPSSDGPGLRMYISGDTLLIDDLRAIPNRYDDIDVAVLHLGGTTLPGGLMVTMDGEQGAQLLELLHPATSVPIHVDDYGVFKSPLSAFREAVARPGLSELVTYVARGETVHFGSGRGTD